MDSEMRLDDLEPILGTNQSSPDPSEASSGDEDFDDDAPAPEESEQNQVDDGPSPLEEWILNMGNDSQAEQHTSEVDISELRDILDKDKSQLNTRNVYGKTPLNVAAGLGLVDIVHLLLEEKCILDSDNEGWSPLHVASRSGHEEVVSRLLKEYKIYSNIDSLGTDACWTALHCAAYNGRTGVVSILLQQGAKLDIKDKDGWTPLMTATQQRHVKIMAQLIARGQEDVDSQLETCDKSGLAPLFSASKYGFLEGVRLLMDAGADCNARVLRDGCTPLISASSWGYRDVVVALLDPRRRTKINAQDKGGKTALHFASYVNRTKVVELLLAQDGINHQLEDKDGRTALHLASLWGNESVVKLLLAAGASIEATDKEGKTALHLASGAGPEDKSPIDPELDGPDELTPEERRNPEFQTGRHSAVVQLLLERGANPGALTNDNETALHLAAARGDPERLGLILNHLEEGDLSARNNQDQTALFSAFEGDNSETALRILLGADLMRTADFGGINLRNVALEGVAKYLEAHDIAKMIFRKSPRNMHPTKPRASDAWGAIQWAAYEQLLPVLELLIVNSPESPEIEHELRLALLSTLELAAKPDDWDVCEMLPGVLWVLLTASVQTPEIEAAVKEAFDKVKEKMDEFRAPVPGQTGAEVIKVDRSGPLLKHFDAVKDILGDLPFTQTYKDRKAYGLPNLQERFSVRELLESFGATVVQFYKSEDQSGVIRRDRQVQEVIYDRGPKTIMNQAVKDLRNIFRVSSAVPRQIAYLEEEPKLTWVHLPVTNMDWMEDLLKRIMKEENCSAREYYDARSFFRGSWAEVPDTTSPSRIMRPRIAFRQPGAMSHADRSTCGTTKGEKAKSSKMKNEPTPEGNQTKRKQRHGFVAASALYMPYFCFSYHFPNEVDVGETNPDETQRKFKAAKERHDELLQAYQQSAVHGSPTLDEWYYQFAMDDESTKERHSRNNTQIVTKFFEPGKIHEVGEPLKAEKRAKRPKPRAYPDDMNVHGPSQSPLLRVNQLWAWTIADKWLVTATSSVYDDHGALVDGILDQLSKQADSRGSSSQLGSPLEMSRFIVDYCIRSYERKPKTESPVSIGQIFSHYMNRIGREESALFQDLNRQTKSSPFPAWGGTYREGNKTAGSLLNEASLETSTDQDIKDALEANVVATELYYEIRDVRDELNILKSAAQYQKIIQEGLSGNRGKDENLSGAYVVNDLREKTLLADRIQSAVNTTISLQQNKIANLQATLAARQGALATQQGKILMAFTFATLLFLPLSFLSSLFALDVASFQQTPAWAFAVIFLVSVAVSVILALAAIYWDRIRSNLRKAVGNGDRESPKANPDTPGDGQVNKAAKKSNEEENQERLGEDRTADTDNHWWELHRFGRHQARRRPQRNAWNEVV